MASVVGDTSELVRKTIHAKATHKLTGASGSFYFKLKEVQGIRQYHDTHAKVVISGPILVSLSGAVSSTIATSANVAVVPDKYSDWPTTEEQVVQLQGSIRVQNSLMVPSQAVPIVFGNETTEYLKPKTLTDYPPVVVGHWTVAGGTAQTVTYIVLTVPLVLEGIAHQKTW